MGYDEFCLQPQVIGVPVDQLVNGIFHDSIFSLYSEGESPTSFLNALL